MQKMKQISSMVHEMLIVKEMTSKTPASHNNK